MLKLDDISFSYGEKVIFDKFSFSANENEITAILGASGSGKTTLMNIAAGLAKPVSGEVAPFSGERTGFIFQENRLLPWESCIGNITLTGVPEEKAARLLHRLGLSEYSEKYPAELSGGMARRLSIARALAYGEDLFFLDEPLRGLDVKTSEEVLELIKETLKGKTALLITHNPHEAFVLSDRIVIIGNRPAEILGDHRKSEFSCEEELLELLKKTI